MHQGISVYRWLTPPFRVDSQIHGLSVFNKAATMCEGYLDDTWCQWQVFKEKSPSYQWSSVLWFFSYRLPLHMAERSIWACRNILHADLQTFSVYCMRFSEYLYVCNNVNGNSQVNITNTVRHTNQPDDWWVCSCASKVCWIKANKLLGLKPLD